MDEGYIKFNCQHTCATWHSNKLPLQEGLAIELARLDSLRTELFHKKLIGMYENGIGYGNISLRCFLPHLQLQAPFTFDTFIISSSATGGHEHLGLDGYCHVPNVTMNMNTVWSVGKLPASSETMTHAAIYQSAPQVNCVVHIHHRKLYDILIAHDAFTKTAKEIPYGTVEMAHALCKIVKEIHNSELPEGIISTGITPFAGGFEGQRLSNQNLASHGQSHCVIMGGHDEGILFFGNSIDEVDEHIKKIYEMYII